MTSTRLQQSIEAEEAFRESPYKDSEKLWTVGIGACLERSTISTQEWKVLLDRGWVQLKITHEGAKLLMNNKLEQRTQALIAALPAWTSFSEARREVLIHMAYQMGMGFIAKFPKFIAAVKAHDWPAAKAHGLDSDWAREQSPSRARRLMNQLERGTFK